MQTDNVMTATLVNSRSKYSDVIVIKNTLQDIHMFIQRQHFKNISKIWENGQSDLFADDSSYFIRVDIDIIQYGQNSLAYICSTFACGLSNALKSQRVYSILLSRCSSHEFSDNLIDE